VDISPTILIVDDDQGLRKTLSDILRLKGYKPVAVDTGQAALAEVAGINPVLALIDLKLEDMSGLDLLKLLKKQTDTIECILLTGHATQKSAIEAVNLGAYGYMQKPYDVEQLLVMIGHAIEKQEAKEALRAYADRLTILHQQVQRHAAELEQRIIELQAAQAAERAQRELAETLREVTTILNSSLDLEQVLRVILEQLARVVEYDTASVMLTADDNNVLEIVARQSRRSEQNVVSRLKVKQLPHVQEVLEQRRPVIVGDTTIDSRWMALPGTEYIRCWLGVPLVVQDRVIGLLNLNKEEPNFYTNFDAELAAALADQAAIAVENAQLFEQAQQEIKERMRAEAALEMERASLARRVEERTVELKMANAELARASRLKDEFLASMSHELRTPLNAILGLSEALQEQVFGILNEKQLKTLNTIEESGRHLLALINDILDISKIEAGKLTLQKGPISIEVLCQASLRLIKQDAQKKHLQVAYTRDSSVTTVQADQRRLKQILVNLLSNAVKFTPEGGAIGLDVKNDEEDQAIRFVVWDTGIGIAPKDLERLFEPFIQLDSSLARQYAGTGLGLALVRRLTELHEGQVAVESAPEQGSRFIVSLPRSSLHEPGRELISDIAALNDEPSAIILRRALIIEDSPTTAEQFTRYLTEMDIEVVIHPRAEGALEQAQQIQPDIIILDILLPDQPGWMVLAQLQENPQTQNIPVVIISVVDEPARGLSMNAAEYLVKPISRQQLQSSLSRVALSTQASRTNGVVVLPPEPPRVLLVEDNLNNIYTTAEYLSIKGFQVIVARNGQEAIQQTKEACPDVILMDIQMPGMDGLEAIKRIRADAVESVATTSIIALTALSMPGDRERCLEAGADDYLSKPIKLEELVKIIERHLA
jgi:signal transduction histidine kinase/DNA-binding NtrC family response regulator